MYRIGIDYGGTKIETAVFDPAGRVVERWRVPSPAGDGYQDALSLVPAQMRRGLGLVPDAETATLGLCFPGSLDARTGLVRNANAVYLNGKPFKADLEAAMGRKVGMENDANCFAMAEAVQGAGKGFGLVFGVIMGSGCGGGMAIDGKLRPGPNHIAGEWGHMVVEPEGRRCYCGNRGCIETLLSGTGVEDGFAERHGERLPMREIVDKARQGEKRCRETFDRFLFDFGRCLGGLVSILDPDAVVVGGGLSNIKELYTQGYEQVKRFAFHEDISTPILPNKLGDSAGVVGAAWIGL